MIFFVIWFRKKPSSESLQNVVPPLPWESDAFLQPTVPDDGLLQYGMWKYFYSSKIKLLPTEGNNLIILLFSYFSSYFCPTLST